MGNIRIIGSKGSGKTTYLAALAHWPDKRRRGTPVKQLNVQPVNDEAKALAARAENIIRQGESLEATPLQGGIDSVPFYSFTVEINPRLRRSTVINLVVRDFPGEIFDGLVDTDELTTVQQEFWDECLTSDVEGCLVLLTDWQKDKFYSQVLEKFIKLMDDRSRLQDLRLAVAMSKCERGELWPGRLDPAIDLFDLHLPETKMTLETAIPPQNLRFYAISTFGVLGRNDPRPNRIDVLETRGTNSVLREPRAWKPYGLLAPLYWLSRGKPLNYV